ncbi:unnamed protein product [Triticum turgidum subsp. durum]|uniref:EF-hand domain-containing protein n=1 Tax=Triticum turgidum subsp. durum TaxID=4567 RepID=A0A9R0XAF7_TRITD|nr:unnamed protein product [Triticum turgidum subsp. durum]
MSHLSILTFKYNLAKLRFKPSRPAGRLLSARDRQQFDLMMYKPDEEEMAKVFDKIAGEPGRISRSDLQALLQSNKDGYMDLEEFMEVHRNGVQLGDIRRAFFVFDRDRDGRITAEEVMDVLRRLGDSCSLEDCRKMVKEIDRNHDGFVDMDDFMVMMTRPRKRM